MTIFIAADHRGFKLKNKLIKWLKSQKYQVIDCGNTIYDPEDDYPDFVKLVVKHLTMRNHAKHSTKQHEMGVLICGSGVGVSIASNRFRGVRCALGFNAKQIKHARENDHINVLALAADYISLTTAKTFVKTFLTTEPIMKEKYLRRIRKTDMGNL